MTLMELSDVKSVELGITNKCTLRCPHCDSITLGMPTATPVNLDFDVLVSFLNQLPNLTTILLEGAYSDPLMYPRLLDVVSYAKDRKLSIRMCTHGSARSISWWEQLGSMLDGGDVVRFAIDGSTQELHEIYRVNSRLDVVLTNHQALKRRSQATTSLQHIVFEYNKYDTQNVVDLANDSGFDQCEIIQCGNVCISDELQRVGIVPTSDLATTYQRNNRIISSFSKEGRVTCDSLMRSEIYINHRGEVTLCADHDDGTVRNNIYNTPADVLLGQAMSPNRSKCFRFCNQLEYNIGKTFPAIVHAGGNTYPIHFHTRELK